MMHNRATCNKCRVCFVKEYQNQPMCYRCLTEAVQRKKRDQYVRSRCLKGKERICECCGKKFFESRNRKTCSSGCRYKLVADKKRKIEESLVESKKIQDANEKWLIGDTKKKKKGKTLEQLDKEAEYKRVFDDKGWNHYLKGRKYDKI